LRALITGASGFAGGWLVRECEAAGDEVVGVSRTGTIGGPGGERQLGASLDLRDGAATRAALRDMRPDVVYHLAALSSVGRSWEDPEETMKDNAASAASVLEAVRHEAPEALVLWISSCEVYGRPASLPLDEDAPLAPANPYAVSKAAGEMLARVYAQAYGLRITCARPFSHAGPGQLPIFILSSLARQAAEGRLAGVSELRVVTGNPETRRDFTDVRDIVRAYRMLAESHVTRASGSVAPGTFNVSSGASVSAADQVALLAELIAPIRVEHAVDPARVRAHEVMDLRGAHDRLTAATGWTPQISFRQTMADTIAWWEHALEAGRA
jgi:GDP-4-dehydro-6-deoxy-D-mannose reductase